MSNEDKKRLQRLGVETVYLFGSRASGIAREDSDYDIGVVFRDGVRTEKDAASLHGQLYNIFSNYVQDVPSGARPDIALLQNANGSLQMSAVAEGVVLFEADPVARANYEEGVIAIYDDYRPLRRMYEEATTVAFLLSPT